MLTAAGEQLLEPASDLLRGWDAMVRSVEQDQQSYSGSIRIAAPVAVGQNLLALLVSRFLLRHPRVTVEMDLRDDRVDLLKTKYDVWLKAGAVPDNLIVQDIYRVKRTLVAATHSVQATHPRELVDARAVRLQTFVPRVIALTHTSGERYSLSQKTAFASDHLEAVRTAALQGVGYAVLPIWAVNSDLADGKLVRVCTGWDPPPITFSIAFPPDTKRPARVDGLIRFLSHELSRPNGFGIEYLRQLGVADTVELLR
jgi:DNA-binding transcriptional LysR family regulator